MNIFFVTSRSYDDAVATPESSSTGTDAAGTGPAITEAHGTEQAGAPAATRLVLIRHGESRATVDRVIGGFRTCRGLSPLGRRQVEHLRDRLAATGELDGAVWISSNFERAIETARLLAPVAASAGSDGGGSDGGGSSGDGVRIDTGFGEHDPGPELDGMSFDDYVARYGTPDRSGDPHTDVFPGGETLAEFHLRVGASLSRTLAEFAGRLVVISCHGGVVDAVFRQLLRTSPTGAFDLWTLNTSLTEFHLERSGPAASDGSERPWRLVRYNDAAHLAGLPAATPRTGAAAS